MIRWKGINEADLVPAKVARLHCPNLVIQFYEERLLWHSNSKDEDLDEEHEVITLE